jgi:hypothetical protein
VLSEECSSWSNGSFSSFLSASAFLLKLSELGGIPGGRIHGHWPGSSAHSTFVRRSPRWEDFDYELLDNNKSKNRIAYLGNGWSRNELDPDSDLTPYQKAPEKVGLRGWHESWWDL